MVLSQRDLHLDWFCLSWKMGQVTWSDGHRISEARRSALEASTPIARYQASLVYCHDSFSGGNGNG
jgi:hypothetical protein